MSEFLDETILKDTYNVNLVDILISEILWIFYELNFIVNYFTGEQIYF